MVMQVEVRQHNEDRSFLISMEAEEENINLVFVERDDEDDEEEDDHLLNHHQDATRDASFNDRDTSTTCRNMSLENTRDNIPSTSFMNSSATSSTCPLNASGDSSFSTSERNSNNRHVPNTQKSILDLTKEDEDDDSIAAGGPGNGDGLEESVLFHDLQTYDEQQPQQQETSATNTAVSKKQPSSSSHKRNKHKHPKHATLQLHVDLGDEGVFKSDNKNPFSLHSVTDRFVDGLCPASFAGESACAMSNPYCSSSRNSCDTSYTASFATPSRSKRSCSSSPKAASATTTTTTTANTPSASCVDLTSHQLHALNMDLWNLLGCSADPDLTELEYVWEVSKKGGKAPSNKPVRANIQSRLARIHRLRMDRALSGSQTRHGVTIAASGTAAAAIPSTHGANHHPDNNMIRQSLSMPVHVEEPSSSNSRLAFSHFHNYHHHAHHHQQQQEHHHQQSALAAMIGAGIEPIPAVPEEHDGYDSDPEFGMATSPIMHNSIAFDDYDEGCQKHQRSSSTSSRDQASVKVQLEQGKSTGDEEMSTGAICRSVQQTLNSTWTLTWHPNKKNCESFGVPAKPMCINIWMERGTVVSNNGVVIEPTFMWRDAFQDKLVKHHKLNASTQKPWSMRVLNVCRIAPCDKMNVDRKDYPFACKSNSLLLRTCYQQEFLLEGSSPAQISALCEQWKLAVARFASLAVTEDIEAIAREFFHPTLVSQTLTLQDLTM